MKISEFGISQEDQEKLLYILRTFNAQECKLIDRDTIFRGKTISGIDENEIVTVMLVRT